MADLFFGHRGNKLPSSPKPQELARLADHAMVTPRRKFGRWATAGDALEAPKAFPASLQEFVLELAADVEQLWQHLRMPGLSDGELRKSAIPDSEPSPNVDAWVADELMSLRAELRSSYAELTWSISDVEQRVRSSLKVLEALENQQQELQETIRQHSGSCGDELDFGAPIGKTLNTQDMLALHVQLKSELNECRMDIRRLTGEHLAIKAEETESLGLTASKTRPLQLTDIETTSSGLTCSMELLSPISPFSPISPIEKQESGLVKDKIILTL